MDTLLRMPIQDRKYYIRRHNSDVAAKERAMQNDGRTVTYEGESLNTFAKMEQSNKRAIGGGR